MRWVFRIIAALVFLGVVGIGAVFLIPTEKIGSLLSQQVEKATGRSMTLSGTLKPSIWPTLGLTTGAVTLSNADWATAPDMVRAKGLNVGVDAKALWGGEIAFKEITLVEPEIWLERSSDGSVNWLLDAEPPAQAEAPQSATPETGNTDQASVTAIDLLQVQGGIIHFSDAALGTQDRLDNINVSLRAPKVNGEATLDLSAVRDGQPFAVNLVLGKLGAALQGQQTPMRFDFGTGAASVRFDGIAGTAPVALNGALQADLSDLQSLFNLAQLPPPTLPAAMGQTIKLGSQIALTSEGTLQLRDMAMGLDGNTLRGQIDLVPGVRPKLLGNLSMGSVNLPNLIPETAKSSEGRNASNTDASTSSGWPTAPIDIAPLGLMEADVVLAADSLNLGQLQLGTSQAHITLIDRRLVLDIQKLEAFEGQIAGELVVNGRGSLSVRTNLQANSVALAPMLRDLAGYERLSGTANSQIALLGSGASVDAIMKSLKGTASFDLGAGTLSGVDLERVWRRQSEGQTEGERTVFNAASASFNIEDGVAKTSNAEVTADRVVATGVGEIDLGRQRLDMTLTPRTIAQEEDGRSLIVPLNVDGPWAAPSFALDLDEALKQNTEKKREEIRETAKDKAAEKLGVTRDEGETLEDAAKRKLRENAGKELRKLFNR